MKTIMSTLVGSKLYGLSTENSDTDVKGIFVDDLENILTTEDNYFGLKTLRPKERQESCVGEGKDKVESTLYSMKYFMELYLKGNPTLAEIPFADEKYWIVKTEIGVKLLEFIRTNVVTKHLFGGYYGYYRDQIRGLVDKKGVCREKRRDQVEKFGFDCKMSSHAYRIGVQGVELFTTGIMHPTLTGSELETARQIKQGGYHTREQIIQIVTDLGNKLEEAKDKSSLPDMPDFDKVHRFCVDIHKEYFYGKKH